MRPFSGETRGGRSWGRLEKKKHPSARDFVALTGALTAKWHILRSAQEKAGRWFAITPRSRAVTAVVCGFLLLFAGILAPSGPRVTHQGRKSRIVSSEFLETAL